MKAAVRATEIEIFVCHDEFMKAVLDRGHKEGMCIDDDDDDDPDDDDDKQRGGTGRRAKSAPKRLLPPLQKVMREEQYKLRTSIIRMATNPQLLANLIEELETLADDTVEDILSKIKLNRKIRDKENRIVSK